MSHGHACWLVKLIPGFIDLITYLLLMMTTWWYKLIHLFSTNDIGNI